MKKHIAELRILQAAEYAADKHRFQRRKDKAATPYINHPLSVAFRLAAAGESDAMVLMAALLHDTIEDTNTSYDDLKEKFGIEVADVVLELTDDKHLSKEERKRRQVDLAAGKSLAARKVKLADKICNVNDILHHPPDDWSVEEKVRYILWSKTVVDNMRGSQPVLEQEFDELFLQCRTEFKFDY